MTSSPPSPTRILVVDDDDDIRETLRQVLADEGYAVDTAMNGLEALNQLRSATPPPSLILLDLMMPVLNGFEFQLAKSRDPLLASIPVIIVSASLDARARTRSMHPIGVLEKPISLEALLASVARHAPLTPDRAPLG